LASLSESLIQELKEMRLTTEKIDSSLSVQVKDLLDEKVLCEYLKLVRRHIDASNDKVTGSIFIKRYAFLAVMYLYTMTSINEKLLISFDNLSIETDEKTDVWLPSFYFSRIESEAVWQDREAWRRSCLEALFKEHLYPLINCVAKTTKVSKLVLWENIAIYIFWLYETVLQREEITKDIKEQAKDDFHFIIFQAEGELFGNYHENPLKRFYKEKIYYEEIDKELRQRTSCCFAYLTKSKQHCSTCPCVFGNRL